MISKGTTDTTLWSRLLSDIIRRSMLRGLKSRSAKKLSS